MRRRKRRKDPQKTFDWEIGWRAKSMPLPPPVAPCDLNPSAKNPTGNQKNQDRGTEIFNVPKSVERETEVASRKDQENRENRLLLAAIRSQIAVLTQDSKKISDLRDSAQRLADQRRENLARLAQLQQHASPRSLLATLLNGIWVTLLYSCAAVVVVLCALPFIPWILLGLLWYAVSNKDEPDNSSPKPVPMREWSDEAIGAEIVRLSDELNEIGQKRQQLFDEYQETRDRLFRFKPSIKLRQFIFQRDEARCYLCGVGIESWTGDKMHIDHVVPWSTGGSNRLDNLRATHPECNIKKGAKDFEGDDYAGAI